MVGRGLSYLDHLKEYTDSYPSGFAIGHYNYTGKPVGTSPMYDPVKCENIVGTPMQLSSRNNSRNSPFARHSSAERESGSETNVAISELLLGSLLRACDHANIDLYTNNYAHVQRSPWYIG